MLEVTKQAVKGVTKEEIPFTPIMIDKYSRLANLLRLDRINIMSKTFDYPENFKFWTFFAQPIVNKQFGNIDLHSSSGCGGNLIFFAEISKEEGEHEELKENVRQLKKQLGAETRRREEVEKALEDVVIENQQLEDKIMRLEHDHGQLQMEIHNVQVRSVRVCTCNGNNILVLVGNLQPVK